LRTCLSMNHVPKYGPCVATKILFVCAASRSCSTNQNKSSRLRSRDGQFDVLSLTIPNFPCETPPPATQPKRYAPYELPIPTSVVALKTTRIGRYSTTRHSFGFKVRDLRNWLKEKEFELSQPPLRYQFPVISSGTRGMPLLVAQPLQDITYMATTAGSRRRSRGETFPVDEEERGNGHRASKRRKEEKDEPTTKTAKKKTTASEKRVTRSSIGGELKVSLFRRFPHGVTRATEAPHSSSMFGLANSCSPEIGTW
jgi:hypothetical protein